MTICKKVLVRQRDTFHLIDRVIDNRSGFLCLLKDVRAMAIPVVEFSREGYKIRKVFG